ncbi:MAG: DUF2268 domain-containing putative Zn-dependent protease [Candidatus Aminicenantia bacterium]
MKVYSWYKDFFKFLEKMSQSSHKWQVYFSYYYQPHQEFLDSYFNHFPLMNFSSLKERVETIKSEDYAYLKSLIKEHNPEKIIIEAYHRCREIFPTKIEPEVYLFVGFFSPDGFVMEFKGKPVICFGLERFKGFRLLKILFAHEYGHFLLNLTQREIPQEKKIDWFLISEGLATYLSRIVFPEYKLSDHLFLRRDRLNWLEGKKEFLKSIYYSYQFKQNILSELLLKGDPELDIPPQAGKYLGYLLVSDSLRKVKSEEIASLFSEKDLFSLLKKPG